jgi:hypothetical protein
VTFSDTDLYAAKKIRTVAGWYEFYCVTDDSVVAIGDFADVRIPRSMILEVR